VRVLVAALLVIWGMFAAVVLLAEAGAERLVPPWVLGLGLGLLMLGLSGAAVVLLNPWWENPLGLMTPSELLRRLGAEGLLVASDFHARRAFGAREYDDEGPHYFVELDDGRVLYLNGQYLYDYEPVNDGPGENEIRLFPCTDFTVYRHKIEGYVVGLVCRGTPLEPEFVAPPLTPRARRWIGHPEDGRVLAGRPYDQLKQLLRGEGA
jgi:hypothetical protein